MERKYLVLCNRHNSIYGDHWALFWGCRESASGYTSDIRIAHRFTEEEIKSFTTDEDIPIPIDVLNLPEGYISENHFNSNFVSLVERATLNGLLGLKLKPLFREKKCCPNCGEEVE